MNQFPLKRNAPASSSVNHKKHPFYLDQQNNSRVPKWFIECSRQDAESLLTVRQDDGNVLMRPSQLNPYALSIRTVINGVGKFNHYAVQRNSRGEFFMDIDNPHSPVPSLSQVIELFIQLAGPTNHRAFGTSRTAGVQKLSPTLSHPPPGILQRPINTDNRCLQLPVAPVSSLHKPLSHRPSVNAYIDRPRTDVHHSVERVASRPDYLHIQSTDETSDYLHPAADDDDVHTATDAYDAGHYLTLTDEVLKQSQLSSAATKSDYLIVTDDIDSTTTTPFADNCEQQIRTTTTATQQQQQQHTSGYLVLTDETDDQPIDKNNVYDKPKTNYSEVKNPVANYINLDAKVKPLCSESNCHTQSTSLSKCGVGSSFNSNKVYESPRSTKPDYINLSAAVGVSPMTNGHRPPLQPRKPKPAAVAPDYLKAYVPEDSDLPDLDAPPPPSTANHVKSRRSPPSVPGSGLKGLGTHVSPAAGPGSDVGGPAGPVSSSAHGGPLRPAGGRGDSVLRPVGGGIRSPGGPLTPAGGRGGPANPAGNLSRLAGSVQ